MTVESGSARGAPALFAVHGDADDRRRSGSATSSWPGPKAVGLRSEYHRIPGGGHGYEPSGFFTRPPDRAETPFDRLLPFAERELAGS